MWQAILRMPLRVCESLMKRKEIIFYAPLGYNIPAYRCGGAEAGCRKTLAIYQTHGINVTVIDKPAGAQGLLRYFWGILAVPFILIGQMLKHLDAPVHIVGFYRGTAYYEWFLLMLCRLFGHKTIYELRNGSMIDSYEKGGRIYRTVLKDLLLKPDVVLCQGQEYIDFIEKNWKVTRSYYPNFLMDEFILPNNVSRPMSPIRLVYFGRVTPAKNVKLIIEILLEVIKDGYEARLDVFGGYDEAYGKELKRAISFYGIDDKVCLHGRQSFSVIADSMRTAHYFLFPSQEKQEGHSNSLTEAMGCGVVPIVSRVGFNASICGNEELVVDDYSAVSYAKKIVEIESAKRWEQLSAEVYSRTKENFTESIVGNNLINIVEDLYK